MAAGRQPAQATRTRKRRGSARLRLTLLYAGLFLALGTVLLTVTYALVARSAALRVTAEAVPAQGRRIVEVPAAPVPPSQPGSVSVAPVASAQPRGADPVLRDVLTAQHSADLSHLLVASLIVLALTTLISAWLGWIAAGRVLRPVRTITQTARTISAGNLHERLALDGPNDEFKALGDTLDELLARLDGSFESQRRFTANASHELRTPLTLERTLLQVALANTDASAGELRVTCEELLASNVDQERLLEALLTLAAGERGLDRHEQVDLAALTDRVLLTHRAELERRDLQLTALLEPASMIGDSDLVDRMIANLIENAAEYNTTPGQIEVRTYSEAGAGRATLSVTNSGPIVPEDQLDRLLEPFQRLDHPRTGAADGHHGLGLSIVAAIAASHGAEVELRAPAQGGLAVTIRFAADPSEA